MFGRQSLDGIFHQEDLTLSVQQALGSKLNTELGDHAEDNEVSILRQALYQ